MKHLITIIVSMIFFITFNTKAFASDSVNLQTKNNIDTSIISEIKLDTTYLISNQNLVTEAFSPEQNLDFTIGILLSIIPSFGVGNFWSGDKDGGWFFFKLDLIMLAIPFIISIISNIFYSLNISKNNNSDSMSNSPDIFTLLGLVAWSSSFGVKIWETASVYKYISTEKKIEKISISKDQISIKLLDF